MPPRNLYAIIVIAMVSILCHEKAERFRNGALVGDAIALIDRFYVDDVQERDLVEAAMGGLTSQLDPYTQFIPPTAYDDFQDSIQQEFAGVGILINQPDPEKPVRVITPLVGSPALEAGFLPGDQIVEIDGQDTSDRDIDGVRELLRGPIDSRVRVIVRRRADGKPSLADLLPTPSPTEPAADQADTKVGDTGNTNEVDTDESDTESPEPSDSTPADTDPGTENASSENANEPEAEPEAIAYERHELVVRRANIMLESVNGDFRDADNRWVYHLRDQPEIAYVRLTSFGERTTSELRNVLESLDADTRGLVLDLRGNSGGLLISAVEVCDMFLDGGRIVSTRGRGVLDPSQNDPEKSTEAAYDATPGTAIRDDLPIALLIDGDSASASEIVAACLKDRGRATVIGERSFGKGSVQNVFAMEGGKSALKMTTARYYRPNGANIHRDPKAGPDDEWGVRPSEGCQIDLDDEARSRIIRRWEVATYPSMAAALPTIEALDGPLEEVDPVLWRAVETLKTPPTDSSAEPDRA